MTKMIDLEKGIVPYPIGGMIYYVETTSETDEAWIANKPIQYIDKEGYHCGWGLATLCFKFSDLGEVYFFSREEAKQNLGDRNIEPKKCTCFHEEYGRTVCYGTKEREECSCAGDKSKCNFYPEYRKQD